MNARDEPGNAEGLVRGRWGELAGLRNGIRSAAELGPLLAVTGVCIGSLIIYATLAHAVESPRIFIDELVYWDTAASLAHGEGLNIRGEPYPYGALYPALLAGIFLVFPDRELAYELAKTLNAFLFALGAVPVYLLARRVLVPWASVGAALLSVAVPSSMYVSVVMTESLAYLTAAWTAYAIVLALERPTVVTQTVALAAMFVAYSARPQLGVLYAAYLVALGLTWVLCSPEPGRRRHTVIALWPTLLSLAAALTALVLVPLLRGESLNDLGGYQGLLRAYDPGQIVHWLLYHVANLELYLAVIPLAVAPIVLASFVRRARQGSRRHAAFVALFTSANAAILLVAAVVNTTESTHGRLHDRYVFYLAPFWLIVLLAWLQDGARRPRVETAIGAAAALLLPAAIPFSEYAREDGAQRFAGVASTLWAALQTAFAGDAYGWGRVMLFAFVVVLVALAFLLPRGLARGFSLAAVALTFLVTAQFAWYLAVRDGTDWVFAGTPAGRTWVDQEVPPGRGVTSLTVANPCRLALLGGDSLHRTEFFNESVAGAANIGRRETTLPSSRVHVARGGALRLASGKPFVADYVLTLDDVFVEGRRVAVGTISRLTLWDVGGPVRLRGIGAPGRLRPGTCDSP